MSNKVLKMPSLRAKKRKYDHDLSHVKKFSSSVSQLLPVFYDLAYPGDRYDIKTEMFTQLREIVSPAMTHITERVEWFFVPMKCICHTAFDGFTGVQDFHTTFISKDVAMNATPIPVFDIVPYIYAFQDNVFQNDIKYNDLYPYNPNNANDELYLDIFGVPVVHNICRLSQLLGFGNIFFDSDDDGSLIDDSKHLYLNPMFLCAYQRIFFDCFRIDNRVENDARFYNLDQFVNQLGVVNDDSRLYRWLTMRYSPWKKDLFTSMLPKPLIDYNDIGMQAVERVGGSNTKSLNQFNNPLSGTQVTDNGNTIGFQSDLANWRGALAVEKLMEITRRAKKDYNSQILAHFGFEVPEGVDEHTYRLGSEETIVNINEVVAMADGSNGETSTSLGQKGGRGSAYKQPNNKGIRFTAPCHGIIMGIFHAIPEADYANVGIDKLNTYRFREDYWMPEFDALGMSPIFGYQLAFSTAAFNNDLQGSILGWNYRYIESKLKQNSVNGIFTTLESFKAWTTQRNWQKIIIDAGGYSPVLDWSFFYIDPTFIDSFMLLSFQCGQQDVMNVNSIFARDPLLHWFKFYVHKASEISNYSMPSL